jgi:hypothetical protein
MVAIGARRAFSRLLKTAVSTLSAAGRRHRLAPAHARNRGERGQALLEFAVIFPIMLIFLLIIVDFGLAMDRRVVLQNAVREGARAGATGASPGEIQTLTADHVGITDPAKIDQILVCYVDSDGNGQVGNVGDDVRVKADLTYQFTTGGTEILGAFGVGTLGIPMRPSADMRLENTVPVSPADVCVG